MRLFSSTIRICSAPHTQSMLFSLICSMSLPITTFWWIFVVFVYLMTCMIGTARLTGPGAPTSYQSANVSLSSKFKISIKVPSHQFRIDRKWYVGTGLRSELHRYRFLISKLTFDFLSVVKSLPYAAKTILSFLLSKTERTSSRGIQSIFATSKEDLSNILLGCRQEKKI